MFTDVYIRRRQPLYMDASGCMKKREGVSAGSKWCKTILLLMRYVLRC